MSVRIIIDREVKKGKEVSFARASRKLRTQALFAKGYISGEIFRVRDKPQNYIVTAAWESVVDWEKYEELPETRKIRARMERLMAKPAKVKVCMYA